MAKDAFYYVWRGDAPGLISILGQTDINSLNGEGQSLLQLSAIRQIPLGVATELIRRGIDVNLKDQRGRTALVYAAEWKRRDVAEAILQAGGRLDIADEHGNQPLWYAVGKQEPDYEMIKLFMRAGANPAHLNKYGKGPLDIAREEKSELLLCLLSGESRKPER